jgi:hypothetical protein
MRRKTSCKSRSSVQRNTRSQLHRSLATPTTSAYLSASRLPRSRLYLMRLTWSHIGANKSLQLRTNYSHNVLHLGSLSRRPCRWPNLSQVLRLKNLFLTNAWSQILCRRGKLCFCLTTKPWTISRMTALVSTYSDRRWHLSSRATKRCPSCSNPCESMFLTILLSKLRKNKTLRLLLKRNAGSFLPRNRKVRWNIRLNKVTKINLRKRRDISVKSKTQIISVLPAFSRTQCHLPR